MTTDNAIAMRFAVMAEHIADLTRQRDALRSACDGALSSLEYVERTFPMQSGYGVRQDRISQLRSALALCRRSKREQEN